MQFPTQHLVLRPSLESKSKYLVSKRRGIWLLSLLVVLLVVDQISKIWVKTSMTLGQEYYITSWFRIHFIENDGMAYGITLGSKLFLTIFRLVAMSALSMYLFRLLKSEARFSLGFLTCMTMILAGGVGNLLDSVFYGQIFSESTFYEVANLVDWGEGYQALLYGKVVDMLYFPIYEGVLPSWVPIWGGEMFIFFRPIFNLADSYISVAVFVLILFYPRALNSLFSSK